MRREELETAIEILKNNGASKEVITELEFVLKQRDFGELNLIDKNAYISTILWEDADIEAALVKNEIEVTDERIADVANHVTEALSNCESGWDAIDEAIQTLF